MLRRLPIALLLLVSAVAFADDVWTPETMILERNPGDVAVSPCGRWVAYTVSVAVMEEERSEFLTHIWISAADGSRTYKLTSGESSCTDPAWSPAGDWIAFLSDRSGKNNIWLIRPDGGEAERLTDVKNGVNFFRWSPDGSEIAFLMDDPPTEEEEAAERGRDDARVVGADLKYRHIYCVRACVLCDERPEPVRVTEGEFHVTDFDWSPDGETFVFSHRSDPDIDGWPDADISTVPAGGGEPTLLVGDEGADSSPLFSPDGSTVAFTSNRGDSHWAGYARICLVPAGGGEVIELALTSDEEPDLIEWANDGGGLYYREAMRTESHLFYLPADGGPYRRLTDRPGILWSADVCADGALVSYAWEDLEAAPEVYTMALDGGEPLQISNINGHLPELPYARSEIITWTNPDDGMEIEGILTYPLGYEEGESYPLLLVIHGGPAGVFVRNNTAGTQIYPIQAFAARGFAVLRPNPRGSAGRGREFRYANIRDWGGGDYADLMAGVDHLIATGLADPERLGVMGWSYGGYMTSWIITQTDRFVAASVGAGVTDLFSFSGTSDINAFLPSYFEAEVWEDDAVYRAHSAMFHVGNAVTPTLIIHGANDARVPIGQGYELYDALRRMGVEVQMVVLPRTPHGPREPKLYLDTMRRHLDWFCERIPANEEE